MGCDIHMFLEYRVGDGPWQADVHHNPPPLKSCITQKYAPLRVCDQCSAGQEEACHEHGYDNAPQQISATSRDYRLFGALAGVRCIGPEPKGLPGDISALIKQAADYIGNDGHSHSYISLEEFKKILQRPDLEYTSNANSDAFYEKWGKNGASQAPQSYSTIVNYGEKLQADRLADQMLLGDNLKVDVRLVFWFDN
jgi:hypothetical protein